MEERKNPGSVIGVTDEGQLIVTEDYLCPRWTACGMSANPIKECWYCKYADFRKSTEVPMCVSICRCPENRVTVLESAKNENLEVLGGNKR